MDNFVWFVAMPGVVFVVAYLLHCMFVKIEEPDDDT